MGSINFNFYGVKIKVSSDSEDHLDEIRRDFSYFLSNNKICDINIETYFQDLPYNLIPQVKASLYLPSAIAYDHENTRYVDYNGQALTIYNYPIEKGQVYSENKELLHEISYLLILSRVGELLDRKGIHRIHALGISISGKAALCLLPMGAGKTTLALDLLKYKEIKLLSDDMVLIDKKGRILPFPLRIGVDRQINLDIPSKFLREFHRRQYGVKTLIDIEYFQDKIATISSPWVIFIGERKFSTQAKIESINKIKAIWPFVRDGIIGLGLPQIVEYFLRNNLKDLNKIPVILSRIFTSFKIILYSKIYKFVIGQDKEKNAKVLIDFLGSEHKKVYS